MISPLKLLRLQAGRPQWEVARQTGIAPSRLSAIENERVVARPDELQRIAAALGMQTDAGIPDMSGPMATTAAQQTTSSPTPPEK